jgi:hypothetical protein
MAWQFSVVQMQLNNCNGNLTTENRREGEARDARPG